MMDRLDLPHMRQHNCYVSGVPELRNLVEAQPGKWLDSNAAYAFARMAEAAMLDGIDLVIVSAWRSMEDQQRLYRQWEEGKRKLRPSKPGWSLHQSGMAADLLRSHDDPDGGGPQVGPTDKWLESHASTFGYYRTVPAELWHWEYKGEVG